MKPATKPKPDGTVRKPKRPSLRELAAFDIPDSAVRKYSSDEERREAFARLAAEIGPKPGERKRKTTDVVGFLIKLRRGEP